MEQRVRQAWLACNTGEGGPWSHGGTDLPCRWLARTWLTLTQLGSFQLFEVYFPTQSLEQAVFQPPLQLG